ncbi:MAG: Extracellular solute-binding protein [Candidatus Beckwithbacteria bacterium GW2011_GWA2_43_10]|uniref:Extracellular solute-binding protein n=1 Tax=Candidatus Beckwithbacteria bacterium GW2011_GWA2_43_10 TaxID=1618369 RepID=A0A0G1C1A0_9BACT|nr:MAG: Extracellular solute-binding protein [Candidatus Beckwithbacteria bacterium GW2011_GWA2_43_10]
MPEDNIIPPEPPFPIAVEEQKPSVQPVSSPPSPPTVSTHQAGEPAQIKDPIFKRLLPILIGLGIIVILFLLITKVILPKFQKPKTPAIITLKYWGLWEPENLMAEIINDYQQIHPNVTVQYVRQSPKDYRERLQSSLAKGDGPDIFRWHNTWLPMLKTDLDPIPDTVFPPNEFDTTFYPIVKKDAFFNGRYYGIPLMFDALVLYVNEDIFQSDPTLKIPTTWDNLRQTAYKLTVRDERGNPTRAGIALGTAANVDNFSDILGLMILQNGGSPGKPDTEAVTSAIKFYTLFASQDRIWSDQLPNSTYAFATAKAVMMIAPSWRALEIKAISPQLNFKLYPVPQLPGTNITWATYWLEGVSKKSANSAAAWEFVKYLSSREVLTKMYNLAAKTRLFGEPYPRQDMASLLQADQFLGAILSQALSAQSWPLSSRTFDNGLNDKIIKYYEDAINNYLNNQPEKDITQNLTQGVTQVLSQYGIAN